jgi:hypothetical protein
MIFARIAKNPIFVIGFGSSLLAAFFTGCGNAPKHTTLAGAGGDDQGGGFGIGHTSSNSSTTTSVSTTQASSSSGGVDPTGCLTAMTCVADTDCAMGCHCNDVYDPPLCQKLYCGANGSLCSEDANCA